jgi:alpha(1,3/1,4) fucosyltransferase
MDRTLRIFFTDFWPSFNIEDNFFINFLKNNYKIEISDKNPDYLFYSVFGNRFQKFNCTRICFIAENIRPNFNECDYAFSFDYINDNPRHYRLPHYIQYTDPKNLLVKPSIEQIMKEKTNFCNFIYSNPFCKKRNDFFKKLSKYKRVDSAGRMFNNMGFRAGNKLEFINSYKFTIAFENESFPGYTTEKIIEPMIAGSLPVYWGNPLVHLDFNPASFLNYYDYNNDNRLIDRIIEVDRNDSLWADYLRQPYFRDNLVNEFVNYDNIRKQFDYIFNTEIVPVSSRSVIFSQNKFMSNGGVFFNNIIYKFNKLKRRVKYFRLYKLKFKLLKLIGRDF